MTNTTTEQGTATLYSELDPVMHWQLRSSRLIINVARPGTIYSGSRFDWTGFITQVELDGQQTFCAEESLDDSGSGGIGLCNEFGIRTAVGYQDAKPGEQFVKPGVGLLTRIDTQPYNFFLDYPIDPFPKSAVVAEDEIRFTIDPILCHGYALKQVKTLKVTDNTLVSTSTLTNVGQRPVHVDEYNHNFIAINGVGPCGDVVLRLPDCLLQKMPCDDAMVRTADGAISWATQPKEAFFLPLMRREFAGVKQTCEDCWWEITHLPSGVTVREETDFLWSHFALFGTERLTCPEAFIDISLAPGASQQWTRTYTFTNDRTTP